MQSRVRKWGNSAAVRLPSRILAAARIEIDQEVDIREEDGRIVIVAPRAPKVDLAGLVARLDPASFPEEVDLGPPAGNEVW